MARGSLIDRFSGTLGRAAGLLALLVALTVPHGLAAAPSAELWPRWQAHDPSSAARIDHAAWNRLLAAYARPQAGSVTRFDYRTVSSDDRAALEAYIADLAKTPISRYSRAEQFAYWVNLYNAVTVDVVLDHYPVRSIRDIDISPGLFANGPWGAKLVTVEGEALSLDDIEHRILRPIWRDPRIHYVVNCAAIGCPNLQTVALTADNAERLMEEAAAAYVNHPRGARIGSRGLVVSSIYAWFEEDFGGSEAGVLNHLRRYAKPELAAKLRGRTGYAQHRYDWSLNGE